MMPMSRISVLYFIFIFLYILSILSAYVLVSTSWSCYCPWRYQATNTGNFPISLIRCSWIPTVPNPHNYNTLLILWAYVSVSVSCSCELLIHRQSLCTLEYHTPFRHPKHEYIHVKKLCQYHSQLSQWKEVGGFPALLVNFWIGYDHGGRSTSMIVCGDGCMTAWLKFGTGIQLCSSVKVSRGDNQMIYQCCWYWQREIKGLTRRRVLYQKPVQYLTEMQ